MCHIVVNAASVCGCEFLRCAGFQLFDPPNPDLVAFRLLHAAWAEVSGGSRLMKVNPFPLLPSPTSDPMID